MKTLWFACTLSLLSARLALAGAGSLNLGWNDCTGSPSTMNRAFACNTDSRASTLVGSFLAPSSVNAADGMVAILDVQTAGIALPSWWGLAPSMCRAGSLTLNLNFTSGPWACVDYWQGGASGAVAVDPPVGNRISIRLVAALPAGSPLITSIPEGDEVYAFKAIIDAAKTTGPGACAGCLTGAAVCLTALAIQQSPNAGGNRYIGQPASRNFALWQGGLGYDYYCLIGDPVRTTTWGSIKSLYR